MTTPRKHPPQDASVYERIMSGDTDVMNSIVTQTSSSIEQLYEAESLVNVDGKQALKVLMERADPNAGSRPCLLCPAEVNTPDGMYRHWVKQHIEVWNGLVEWIDKGQENMPARMNASNRQVYAQMRLWGWTEEKKTNLEVVMKHPNGSTLKIHAPDSHARNEVPVMLAIFQMTGVTADEFWNKEGEDEAEYFNPETVPEPVKNISTKLLDLLIGQGRPLTVEWMAESMGLTLQQVHSAMSYMKNRRLVRKVKRGMWLAVDHREVAEHQTVDMKVTVDQPESVEKPLETPLSPADPIDVVSTALDRETPQNGVQPVPPHREVTDDDVYQVLDLLVPDGFRAKHYPAVNAWVEATKQLVQALREK